MKINELRNVKNNLKSLNNASTLDRPYKQPLNWVDEIVELLKTNNYELIGKGANGITFRHPEKNFAYKIYKNDNAYDLWVDYCIKNSNNPYCPKIIKRPLQINTTSSGVKFKSIRIELLHKLNDNEHNNFMVKFYKNMKLNTDNNLHKIISDINKINPRLLDIHGDNIMKRNNGQIVLVDPIYDFYDEKLQKTILS